MSGAGNVNEAYLELEIGSKYSPSSRDGRGLIRDSAGKVVFGW